MNGDNSHNDLIKKIANSEYKYGFYTDIESYKFPKGLNEEIISAISKKNNEPNWLLNWRLESFDFWKKMHCPKWANIKYIEPDFNNIIYYSAPKKKILILYYLILLTN